jgi:hypothetical protein
MSVRNRVLVLLVSLMVFLSAAAVVSLAVRARAAQGLARVAEQDVPLLALATDVAAAHLEQAIRLEHVLRNSRDRARSAEAEAAYAQASAEYETFAQDIWRRLREAQRVAEEAAAQGAPRAAALMQQVERIDAAHNAYADQARTVFALLEEGRRREALAAARGLHAGEERLHRVLGSLLHESAALAEQAAGDARRDERWASIFVWCLIPTGLLLAAWVFATIVRLVSQMRTLSGLLPICCHCKKIRDDSGYWNQLEAYLVAHSEADFTHGMCSGCQEQMRQRISAGQRPSEAPAS